MPNINVASPSEPNSDACTFPCPATQSVDFPGRINLSLEAFSSSFADLNLAAPLRFEHLRGSDATTRIWIEDGVDDISTARLQIPG
jgi:hypothetical protein